jgi:hypothetical protein
VDTDGNEKNANAGGELGSVYIRKSAFPKAVPQKIKMVVTEEK